MSRHLDRSRSPPRRGSKEWIAKQIVVFGRYADKRPRGLVVNCGSMTLSNLMDAWGQQEELRSSKILEALKLNMMQSDGGSRFEIERLGDDVKIIVNPRCGGSSHRDPPHRRHRMRSLEGQLSLKQKMDMELDEFIATGRTPSNRSKPSPEVIDLEAADFNMDALRPPPGQRSSCTGWSQSWQDALRFAGELTGEGGRQDADPLLHEHSHKVRVSKFVSYVIKKGHAELGIDLWEGWANLHDLVRAVNRERYGNYTLQDLKNVLQDTDDNGRFKYWNDWVRKVDKADRQVRQSEQLTAPDPLAPSSVDVDSVSTSLSQRLRSVSLNVDHGDSVASTTVPKASAPPSQVLPEKNASPTERATLIPAEGRPPPPPGIGWTQYNDDGKLWWYYEGPQGKWWCDEDNDPMPWTFDD